MKPIFLKYSKEINGNKFIRDYGYHDLLPNWLYLSNPVQSQIQCDYVIYQQFHNILTGLRSFHTVALDEFSDSKLLGYTGNILDRFKRKSFVIVLVRKETMYIFLYQNKTPRSPQNFARKEYYRIRSEQNARLRQD